MARVATCQRGARLRQVQHRAVLLHVAAAQQAAQILLKAARVECRAIALGGHDAAAPQHIAHAAVVRWVTRLSGFLQGIQGAASGASLG